jgi:hypothetical protein
MSSGYRIAVIAVAMSLACTAAFAGAADYVFEPVSPEMKKGDDVIVSVRLLHKPTGKPVKDAIIIRSRVDMAPEGMAEMESPVEAVPATEPGVYAFKTDLSMAGRWQITLGAKVQGERETVVGKVIIKAVK